MEPAGAPAPTRRALQALLLIAVAGTLFAVASENYLLFHGLVELFGVLVALSVFTIAWHAGRYMENGYLELVGTGYLFIGFLDLLHALAYPGMSVFSEASYQANQLWVAARTLDAATLLAAFHFLPVRRRPHPLATLGAYGAVTALVVASIFRWKVFPTCFVPGVGQTPFKVASEYVALGMLAAALALLRVHREAFEPAVRRAIAATILLAMAAGVCFSLYTSPYGLANRLGHFFKLFSYVAIYVALVETCVERPFDIVFRELSLTNARLSDEAAARREVARAKDHAIGELRAALDEIRTLRGIIPICAHCKKIRDDQGAWGQIEAYIQAHSEAHFSHGICPDCMRRHYPEAITPAPGRAIPAIDDTERP